MYSPKIAEGLIRPLYWLAKERDIPMTRLVNDFVRQGLERDKHERTASEAARVTSTNAARGDRAA